jgi:hypothetical protein
VTTFTASDFGRTFTSNGDGTDHGWGAHHLVMGGAVRGGNLYGRFPTLGAKNPGNNNFDSSPDQLATARCCRGPRSTSSAPRWALVRPVDSQLLDVFPNLANFDAARRNLGFMGVERGVLVQGRGLEQGVGHALAFDLAPARRAHPLGHHGRRLAVGQRHQLRRLDGQHLDLQVDAVEQRARQAAPGSAPRPRARSGSGGPWLPPRGSRRGRGSSLPAVGSAPETAPGAPRVKW